MDARAPRPAARTDGGVTSLRCVRVELGGARVAEGGVAVLVVELGGARAAEGGVAVLVVELAEPSPGTNAAAVAAACAMSVSA